MAGATPLARLKASASYKPEAFRMSGNYLFRVLLIPASVVLAVMFGGSYASGREIVEFISRHGPIGGFISIAAVILGFGLIASLSFELARMFRAWDYRSLLMVLLGPVWFLYEIVVLAGLAVGLAVVTTVAGTVMQDHFGTPVWLGTLLMFVIVVVMNYRGRELVEKSMMISVLVLLLVLGGLVAYFFQWSGSGIADLFTSPPVDWSGWRSGFIYAGFNASYLPLLLFCVRDLATRGESFAAGIFCAVVMVLPALAFHLVFMGDYPAIIDERLPTYYMFGKVSPAWMLNVYIVVLFVLITQTGVGLLQGFIERVDSWSIQTKGKGLPNWGHGLIAGAMLLVSMALGSVGIVALIAGAYAWLSMAFVFVFILPLFTRGCLLIFRSN